VLNGGRGRLTRFDNGGNGHGNNLGIAAGVIIRFRCSSGLTRRSRQALLLL
jgi:hypothetical protein